MTLLGAATSLAAGYLAGSLPTGFLVARARGIDIRRVGSGNIGATNVARTLGKPLALAVLLVDVAKGFLPTLLAARAFAGEPTGDLVVAGTGALAICGHVFPIWLGLRGGKGVATGFGVFLAVVPLAAAVALALYAAVYASLHVSSVGSLLAATSIPIVAHLTGAAPPYVALAVLAWAIVVLRHRENLRRILRREERRL